MMKVRILVEKWSNQDIIEMTEDEYEKFKKMDMFDQETFLEQNYPQIMSFDVVNIGFNEVVEEAKKL